MPDDSLLLALSTLKDARWIDLTHAFAAGIPHYVAFPDEHREIVTTVEDDGFLVHRYAHVGQWGTHVDPPSHFIAGGRTLDEIPVEDMLLPLIVLDARDGVAADADYVVDIALIECMNVRTDQSLQGRSWRSRRAGRSAGRQARRCRTAMLTGSRTTRGGVSGR